MAKPKKGKRNEHVDDEDLYRVAVKLIKYRDAVSLDYLQSSLHIGYIRTARIMDRLEKEGYIMRPPANWGITLNRFKKDRLE